MMHTKSKKPKAPPRENLEKVRVFVVDIDKKIIRVIVWHRIYREKAAVLQRMFDYLDNNYPLWRYINFYGGITGHYKCRIYNPTHPLQDRYRQSAHI